MSPNFGLISSLNLAEIWYSWSGRDLKYLKIKHYCQDLNNRLKVHYLNGHVTTSLNHFIYSWLLRCRTARGSSIGLFHVGPIKVKACKKTSENTSTPPCYSKNIRLIFDMRSSNLTTIHQIYYSASTWLRSRTFSIRLDDESRVGTPLRRNLIVSLFYSMMVDLKLKTKI